MPFCRTCSSNDLDFILELGMQPWGNHFVPISQATEVLKYALELFICKQCWTTQIGYTVPKEIMFIEHGYLTGTTRSIKTHFKEVADEIVKKILFKPKDYVLDIGGNDGTFLKEMERHNVGLLNIDSGKLQAQHSEKAGIPCLNMFFNEETAEMLLAQKGAARIVHGSNVLYHVEELHSVFSGIKNIMATDGFLVAEFVYLPIIIKNNTFDQIYHEHLLYYTLHSFNRLLAYHRMKLVDVRLTSIHGGSCVAYATHIERAVKPSQKLVELLAEEKCMGVEDLAIYSDFPKKVSAVRKDLLRVIDDLKANG